MHRSALAIFSGQYPSTIPSSFFDLAELLHHQYNMANPLGIFDLRHLCVLMDMKMDGSYSQFMFYYHFLLESLPRLKGS
jgi:hypothetical protein